MDNTPYIIATLALIAASLYVLWGPSKSNYKCKKKYGERVPGLRNFGNTCFLNAILQAWAACPKLLDWLKMCTKDTALTISVRRILEGLNTYHGPSSITPEEVMRLLVDRQRMANTEEQDAHEAFVLLTTAIEEEQVSSDSKPCGFSYDLLEKRDVCPESKAHFQSVSNPFKGRIATQLTCGACQHKCPARLENFVCLSLSIPRRKIGSSVPPTIHDCLTNLCQTEVIESLDCEGCRSKLKGPRAAYKRTWLGKLPKVLCIHLQRTVWSGESSKRGDHVSLTEHLDISQYTNFPRQLCKYRLCALIVHQGMGPSTGHFLTYRRGPEGASSPGPTWFCTSDEWVERCTSLQVTSAAAYMIFYERISAST